MNLDIQCQLPTEHFLTDTYWYVTYKDSEGTQRHCITRDISEAIVIFVREGAFVINSQQISQDAFHKLDIPEI